MRFCGKVGYGIQNQTAPGVFQESIVERTYYGDITSMVRRYEAGETLNDNLQVQNQISIVADAYAYQNFHRIRYVEFMGQKWKVRSVDVQRPRLLLSVGDVYNEQYSSGSSCCSDGYSGACV